MIPASYFWESGSVCSVWRQPAILCHRGQRLHQAVCTAVNYMHIIFSAVDDREEGIFGNTLQIIFFLFPSESLLKWRALTGYIISLFLQLSHYFVCSAAGIIACSFGLCQSVLPVFKESNEANAAKMLIVLWSGSSAIHIQLTVKPVTTS